MPHGLRRDCLAWLDNATTRGGGILQRTGWQPNIRGVSDGASLFQGGIIYEPTNDNPPYFIFCIGGRVIQAVPDSGQVIDLSTLFALTMPATGDYFYFLQAEEFLIIQAGDGVTLPLFWDGTTLRRSNGLTGSTTYPNINELPAATAMEYYMDRVWYAQGRTVGAGDIVKNHSSGTAAYGFRDSILKVTENPLCVGGDNFTVPSQSGNVRGIKAGAQIDAALGEGKLYIFTRKKVYSLTVPVTRQDWINANTTNAPQMTVVQLVNGSVNDRSIVAVNGDLYYQSLDPAIRSLLQYVRGFSQPGNIPISRNVQRALQFNDRSLMRFATGIQFDNRVWQGVLPKQIATGQVIHQAVLLLDFDTVSTLQEHEPPAWDGMYEGLQILQMYTGDFGGLERAFAAAVSELDGTIQVWEFTLASRTQNGDNRVTWFAEFPAFTWGKEFELKQLHGGEIWFDKVFGTVELEVWYRPDADPCWKPWLITQFCSVRNCAEDVTNPVCYPNAGPEYREGYRWPITLPEPPNPGCASGSTRLSNIGYQFQVKIVIKGWMRIRGLLLFAEPKEKGAYETLECSPFA